MEIPKKVGPLPLWAYGVVVVGGLALSYWLYTRNSSSEEPLLVEDTSPVPGVGQLAGGWMYTPPPEPIKDDTDFETNQEWGRYVIQQMIARGYPSSAVDSMVRKYLMGRALNAQEAELRDIALRLFGPPPYLNVPAEPDIPDDPDNPTDPEVPPPSQTGKLPAPTGLTATQVAPGKIHIQWNPVAGASSYWVRATGPTTKTGLAFRYGTQFWHDGLKPGSYKIEVAARKTLLSLDYGNIASTTATVSAQGAA